jgi:hypothetical protein
MDSSEGEENKRKQDAAPKGNWSDRLGGSLSKLSGQYDGLDLKRRMDEVSRQAKDFLEEKGISQKVASAYDATQDHLDVVSGKKILQLVEERLAVQGQYNDILATRLDEALQRLAKLERAYEQIRQK